MAEQHIAGAQQVRSDRRLAFRPLVGVKVLIIAVPARILEASRASDDNFALRVLSGAVTQVELNGATTPLELMQRYKSHEGAADDIPIHLIASHSELALWELDPTEALLGYYPESLSDLPNLQHSQGKFGAAIVDFRFFRDDVEAGIAAISIYAPSLGEIVAIVPRELLARFEDRTREMLPADLLRTTPVRTLGGLALVFAKEGRMADQRFAADNEQAAWCEALDLVSLSGRLALSTRSERVAGPRGFFMRVHYKLLNRLAPYRRIASVLRRLRSPTQIIQRFDRAMEYLRWRYFRR